MVECGVFSNNFLVFSMQVFNQRLKPLRLFTRKRTEVIFGGSLLGIKNIFLAFVRFINIRVTIMKFNSLKFTFTEINK